MTEPAGERIGRLFLNLKAFWKVVTKTMTTHPQT